MTKAQIIQRLQTYHQEKGPFRKVGAFFNSHKPEIALLIRFLATPDIRNQNNDDDIQFNDFVTYAQNTGKGHLFPNGQILDVNHQHKSTELFFAWKLHDFVQTITIPPATINIQQVANPLPTIEALMQNNLGQEPMSGMSGPRA